MRVRIAIIAALALAIPAVAAPLDTAALGEITASDGFAVFGGRGTETCRVPSIYAAGFSAPKLHVSTTTTVVFPIADRVAAFATFRDRVAGCGLPVPAAKAPPTTKGNRHDHILREGADKALAGMDPAGALGWLSGNAQNFHNHPAVLAIPASKGKPATLIVVGKGHPPKSFALPGGWEDGLKAYTVLLEARGYLR